MTHLNMSVLGAQLRVAQKLASLHVLERRFNESEQALVWKRSLVPDLVLGEQAEIADDLSYVKQQS